MSGVIGRAAKCAIFVVVTLLAGLARPAAACEASFPSSVEVGAQTLALNGQGRRIVSPWGVHAYAAALYQPSPTADAAEALQLGRPWAMEMVFCRRASVADIREVWLKSLQQNCTSGCFIDGAATRAFLSTLDDARLGARWRFAFDGRILEVQAGDVGRGVVDAPAFARVLLATWIGAVPPTADLRNALLGRPG